MGGRVKSASIDHFRESDLANWQNTVIIIIASWCGERLQQQLCNSQAKLEASDRAQAQRQTVASYSNPHQTPYPGTGHTRNPSTPGSQSFAWTLDSAASGPSRSFDSRQYFPGLGDTASIGNSPSSATASTAPTEYGGGEHADPSADHTLPRKKVCL